VKTKLKETSLSIFVERDRISARNISFRTARSPKRHRDDFGPATLIDEQSFWQIGGADRSAMGHWQSLCVCFLQSGACQVTLSKAATGWLHKLAVIFWFGPWWLSERHGGRAVNDAPIA
jgi:hypothetical protein